MTLRDLHSYLVPLAVMAVLPLVLGGYALTLFNYTAVFAFVALGLVVMTGAGGITSFGQAAFLGIGAYASAWWTTAMGGSPFVGLALGLVLGGTVGLAQRLLLPARVRRASAWALASAVAAPIAVLFCSAAIERALSGLNPVAAGPSAIDLFAVTVTHARTWMDLALQFGAMTVSALAVRAVIKTAKTSRHALIERHAH